MKFTGERLILHAPGTDEIALEHIARYLFAKQFVKGKQVLDAGCGTGYGTNILKNAGAANITGIDIADEAVSYCQEKFPGKKITFKKGNVTKLSFADKVFDVITSFEVIEHIEKYEEVLKEMHRVLKETGTLIISTPNKKVYAKDNEFHIHEFEETEFLEFLQSQFKHVEFLYQRRPITEIIGPKSKDAWDAIIEINKEDKKKYQPDYFIALCSDSKIPPFNYSATLSNTKGEIFAARTIKDLKAELDKRAELFDLELKKRAKETDREIKQRESVIKERDEEIGMLRVELQKRDEEIEMLRTKLRKREQQVKKELEKRGQEFAAELRKRGKEAKLEINIREKKIIQLQDELTSLQIRPIIGKLIRMTQKSQDE